MQLKNHVYENNRFLEKYINDEIINNNYRSCFVQLLTGIFDEKKLTKILNKIKTKIPNVKIIGSSTADSIMNENRFSEKIIISFSLFEKTDVSIYYEENTDKDAANRLISYLTQESKVIIAFNNGLKNDIEPFFTALKGNLKNAILIGGNAADNYEFKKNIIINDTMILKKGITFAILESNSLFVNNSYALNWLKIGKELVITKADKNRVYEIDNMPVLELYKKYFGEEISWNLPASIIEFPLVKVENGIDIARSLIKVESDNSFIYAGYLNIGDRVRFAIGNVDEIENNSLKLEKKLQQYPSEAIYIYSCSARNLFFKEQIKVELKAISSVAPCVGFFTYGEFFQSNNDISQLNITTTLLSLSETNTLNRTEKSTPIPKNSSTLRYLTNLVNSIQYELDENINYLNQYKDAIDKHTIVSKTDNKGKITYVNDKFCEISGYSRNELIGKSHNIVRHPDFPKENFDKMWSKLRKKEQFKGIIKNMKKNGKSYFVDTIIEPMLDKEENIIEYIGLRYDITSIMNQKLQLKEDLNSLNKPFLVLVKIEDYKIIKEFYNEDIIYQIEDKFSLEILNYFPKKSNYDKVYNLGEGEYAFIKNISDYNKNAIDNELKVLKEFQSNVKKAIIEFKNFEFDINIIISISTNEKNSYEEARLGLKELLKRNQSFIYSKGLTKELDKIAANNIKTIKMIKEAISKKKIVSYFQPIYNNKTKSIEKYESLVRLIDEQEKVISPYFFLETSKKGKYYKQITKYVIKNSFNALKLLEKDITINISILDIEDDITRNMILKNLEECKDLANKVTFELLEDENIKDFSIIKNFIKEAKSYGVVIAIDDFGSGYSNFERLLDFEPDILKIDGSLIKNILTDSYSKNIVEAIILFAKKQNLKIVAEFVSSKEIFDLVNSLDIDYSQGYYIDEPKELSSLIKD